MPLDRVRVYVGLSINRWAWLSVYAAFGSASVWLFETPLHVWLGPLSQRLALAPWGLVLVFLLVPLAASLTVLNRRSLARAFGCARFCRFPPLWIAVVLGVGAFILLSPVLPSGPLTDDAAFLLKSEPFGLLVLLLASAALNLAVALLILGTILPDEIDQLASPHSVKQDTSTFDGLLAWIADDEPVTHPSQDRYGHDRIAEQIANRLRKDEKANTALLGPRGSGKSTVMRLVRHHLRDAPYVVLVPVSLWPFKSVEAAAAGVINALIRALGERVNVLSIAGLASEYTGAIESGGGWLSMLGRLAQIQRNPEEVIAALSSVARTAGYRLVLWVEDFERFSSESSSGESDRSDLGPLRALLHDLNEQPGIVVVMAAESLGARFDAEKIVRYIDRVPTLVGDRGWRELAMYRDKALDGHPIRVIDPLDKPVRAAIGYDTYALFMSRQAPGTITVGPSEIYEAVISIIQTPRHLKLLLRHIDDVWQTMPGEIDLDAAIVATCLRLRCPEVFAVIERHSESIRQGFEGEADGHGSPSFQLTQSLDTVDKVRLVDTQNLIRFLFPDYNFDARAIKVNIRDVVQGFQAAEPTDYWIRFLAGGPIPAGQSDQSILRRVDEWRHRPEMRLFEPWQGSRAYPVLIAFESIIAIKDFTRFFGDWCHEVARHRDRPIDHKMNLMRLRSFRSVRGRADADLLKEIVTLIKVHASTDIGLACEIVEWCANNDAVPQNGYLAAIEALFQSVEPMATSTKGPERLLAALHSDRSGSLGMAFSPFAVRSISEEQITTSSHWPAVLRLVVDAARADPDRALVSLVRLTVFDREHNHVSSDLVMSLIHGQSTSGRFWTSKKALTSLLEPHGKELQDIVARWEPSEWLDSRLLGMARYWRSEIAKLQFR